MSIAALLLGAENWLRSEDVFNDLPGESVGKRIGVQPDPGRPPASSGQWYLALRWSGGRESDRLPEKSRRYHGLTATLTARLANVPGDRRGRRLATATDLYLFVEEIADAVHGRWELIAEANKLITGTEEYAAVNGGEITTRGFIGTLVLDAYGPERPAPNDWVGSSSKDTYVIDIRFRDAERIKAIYPSVT